MQTEREEEAGPSRRAGARRGCLGLLLLGLLVLLVLRAFVGDLYRIESASMEPCLRLGDWVLVRYDRSPPRRWELVVLTVPGEEHALVKRVVGLPKERVQLAGGDLLIDGARPPLSRARPGPIPLACPGWELDGLAVEGCELLLDALAPERPPERSSVLATQRGLLRDARSGAEAAGATLGDLGLFARFALEASAPGAALALGLCEQGDVFWLSLESGAEGARASLARLQRARVEKPEEAEDLALAPLEVAFPGGIPLSGELELALANVDNHLRGWVGGKLLFDLPYEANRFAVADTSFEGLSTGPRAFVRVHASRARAELRLARDLHYLPRGRHAVSEPLQLGPDQLFALGDNSAHSQDSREWGPVDLRRLVGRPLWVLWPPARWGKPGEGPRAGAGGGTWFDAGLGTLPGE